MLYWEGGHVHDGGLNALVYHNGKEICDSQAFYGSQGTQRATAAGGDMEHISSMSGCELSGAVKKGDPFQLTVNYDFTNHTG
jgi:hypothetical protein